ncbi:glucosamine-6-phosphate deaminase [Granulosicoccus antarcticus]|uniref:Glucosamine-6-phosphate deaminase n=1 Tax=Granulosicoccus antarcticus IMCC3135 TaxID=1192854 RepID=A0A2Z2NH26_9GAMM|nr:glucosamine-6-phosphate deaminase [Granulosicoccus antarcticus]ASJ70383.1 Glucosamine-6-phosphate deaminase [Granulosicoccus antarcticus IMCC3135]
MEVIIRPDATAAVELVAQLIQNRIASCPASVLGLATGRTMEQVYASLLRREVSFEHCTSFNLDEYIGLAPDDPQSYRHYMQQHFFSHSDFWSDNTHVPEGDAEDLQQAAKDYEELIRNAGGIDLQLLGIGEAGHIGFNEPLSAIMSRTRDKCLTPTTRRQNAAMFGGDPEQVPKRALTMGVGTILEAREIILLATGEAKAAIIAQAVEGPITSMVSASALQLHPHCKVVVDHASASQLQGREYYDFVFNNEPEWAAFR